MTETVVCFRSGFTPLKCAQMRSHEEIIEILLKVRYEATMKAIRESAIGEFPMILLTLIFLFTYELTNDTSNIVTFN